MWALKKSVIAQLVYVNILERISVFKMALEIEILGGVKDAWCMLILYLPRCKSERSRQSYRQNKGMSVATWSPFGLSSLLTNPISERYWFIYLFLTCIILRPHFDKSHFDLQSVLLACALMALANSRHILNSLCTLCM